MQVQMTQKGFCAIKSQIYQSLSSNVFVHYLLTHVDLATLAMTSAKRSVCYRKTNPTNQWRGGLSEALLLAFTSLSHDHTHFPELHCFV